VHHALAGQGLFDLVRASAAELVREVGLAPGEARRWRAAFRLAERLALAARPRRPPLRSAEAVFRHLAPECRGREREAFYVLALDGKHRLLRGERVSEGTPTTSLVHPREVFQSAIRAGASALIVAHNHPSGDPEPSSEDLDVTRRLLDAARLLGIPLLDHVVLGEGAWASIRERIAFD
jgi:DNA repair protein RadC